LIIFYPIFWLISKDSKQGAQTTLYTLLAEDVVNGGYYADCAISGENTNVTEENWDKLWEISEKNIGIKFNI